MDNKAVTTIIVLAVMGIGGYTYIKSRDTTPVGLVTFKVLGSGEGLGMDDEENGYSWQIQTGTFKPDESSIPFISEDESEPLLIIFKNNEPHDAQVLTDLSGWPIMPLPEGVDEFDILQHWKNLRDLQETYGIDTTDMDTMIEEMEANQQSAEAESVFGPSLTLQSHFVW
tara:strand:+ start:226 stop:735 length:510 start_codon:yes stop_codon:yes gene_type:complete